jgi:photosystem II stability/assembly factor-like uncharacterized protein
MRRRLPILLALACALSAAAKAEIERDDPTERARAMLLLRGGQDSAGQWRVLEEARKQRDRYGLGAGQSPSARPSSSPQPFLSAQPLLSTQRVQGGGFINIGPVSAGYEYNGARYSETDSGRARQILASPTDPGVLYLSTSGGGVWKTWDAGAHWEPITDQLGTTAVGALAMDPLNPDILYLGFGDPFDVHSPGLVKSTDGGITWSDPVQLVGTAGRVASSVTDLKVDPQNSSVFAATNVGLFHTDARGNWQQVALSDPAGDQFFFMWSIAFVGNGTWLATGQAADPTKLPSASANVGQLGLWRSTDYGATWSWNAAALPGGDAQAALAGRGTLATAASTLVDPATARVFLLAASLKGDAQLDLFRSEDGGRSFTALGLNASRQPLKPNGDQPDLNLGHQQSWYNQALTVDPQEPDLVFAGGDYSLLRSSDGGNSWEVLSNWLPGPQGLSLAYIHADLHAVAVGADGAVYVGSDGGIFVSQDARTSVASSVTFSSTANRGLVTHLVYTVACAPETWPAAMQGWVGGGMQDDGTRIRTGSTTEFNQALGGDGIGLAVSASTHLDATLGNAPDVLLASAEFKIFRSADGGQSWANFVSGMENAPPPFFVRIARDTADSDPRTFVTFSGTPAGVYRSTAVGPWASISGILHWQDSGADTTGFVTVDHAAIALRNVATHPGRAGVYAVNSNKYAYRSTDGGAHWLVSLQPAPAGSPAGVGIYLLSSIAFDPADLTGNSYYLASRAMQLVDAMGNTAPLPDTFGHLYRTRDGGMTWTSLGTQPVNAGGLPFVPFQVVAVDPGDANTLYVGTVLGLYRSIDGGLNWARFGAGSLPLVEVSDLCISPASKRLTVATYGRGFWQIGTDATDPAGVKGNGDTNFDQRIDGLDLIDLADAFGTTEISPRYRWQADLVGAVNAIDGDDLAALLAKFGGLP